MEEHSVIEPTHASATQTLETDLKVPSLHASSLSGISSVDASSSLKTASVLSALGYEPSIASHTPSVVGFYDIRPCAKDGYSLLKPILPPSKDGVSVKVIEALDSPDSEEACSPAEPCTMKASASIVESLEEVVTNIKLHSCIAEDHEETPRWLGSKSNDFVRDYFNFRAKPSADDTSACPIGNTKTSFALKHREDLNTPKEPMRMAAEGRANKKPNYIPQSSSVGKLLPATSSSVSLGIGFNADGSGPGFRWLVPPVEATKPVRQGVFASSISTHACSAFGLTSSSIFGFSDFSGFASEMKIAEHLHEPFARTEQRPELRPMDSTLDCLEPPSPMESLPSPAIRGEASSRN